MTLKIAMVCLAASVAAYAGPSDTAVHELLQVEKDWAQAFVKNDAEAIDRFMAEDWIVVDADGHVTDRAAFLGIIRSGALTHQAMTLEEPRVRVYGNTAVVTGRATSSATYNGSAFTTQERSTDVFVKQQGRWRCVLTQLTRLAAAGGGK
jgi:ketosteroid isomerase-like protein